MSTVKRSRVCILVLALTLLLAVASCLSHASSYVPLPGVLGPDQVDFGGKTVTFIGLSEDRSGWAEDFRARVEEAERLFNVKIVGLSANLDTIRNRILAGDSVRDVIRRTHRQIGYFKMVSDGMLYPVGQILPQEYYDSLSNVDRATHTELKYNGQYYSFGSNDGPYNGSMMFVIYNKSMLEREGQQDPYELWKNDEWTWQAMESMAKAATRDTDGDGEIDQWGMTEIINYGVWRFMPFNGVELARIDENGKYVFNYDSPAAINGLNILAKWRNEDKIMVRGQKFEDGRVAFSTTHLGGARFTKQKLQDEWGIVPYPKGPDVDRYYYPVFAFNCTFIPANAENPAGLVALTEFLYRPDDARFEEGMSSLMDSAVTRREQWEVFLAGMEAWQGEGDPFQDSGPLWSIMDGPADQVMYGEKGAAAAMAEIKPQAQAALDDLFHQ